MKHPHLEASKETYLAHMKWAILAGFRLIFAGVASILHGIYPGWFPFRSARTVIDLYHQRLENHPNPDYQEYIKKQR